MSTIDFNKPATTDLYTAWPTSLQANQQSLGFLLDPTYVTSYSNLVTGMYRFSTSSKVFEQWSGSAWGAVDTGYVKDTGDTMTGQLLFNNAVGVAWKDGGGTPRRGALMSSANFYFGDIDNGVTGSVASVRGNTSAEFNINGNVILSATGTAVSANKIIVSAQSESLRTTNDNGFISFYNTAASTRTGYLQGATSNALTLMAENGNSLTLGTNGSNRVTVNASGNLGFNVTPSAWSTLNAIEGSGGALAFNPAGTGALYAMQNLYYNGTSYLYKVTGAASIYYQSGGTHAFYVMASGTAGVAATVTTCAYIDNNGNLLVGSGFTSATSNSAGRGLVEINGSANSLLAFCVGGVRKGYVYHNGTDFLVNADTGTCSLNNAGGAVVLQTNGATKFQGGAYTARVALGSQATLTVDWSKGNYFTMTLTANVASGGWAFSNAQDGQTITLKITQDGTGSRTLTNNAVVKWPGGVVGVLSTAPGAVDILCFTFDSAANAYYATIAKGFA